MSIFKFICGRWQAGRREATAGLHGTWRLIGLVSVTAAASVMAQAPQAQTQQQGQQLIARGAIDLREGPDSVNRFVQRISKGANLETTGKRFGPWLEVTSADGNVGWLQMLDVTATSVNESESILAPQNNTAIAIATTTEATASENPLSASEQRLLQAQTYRVGSEEARRFAFQASLERVRVIGKFDPVPATAAPTLKLNTAPDTARNTPLTAGKANEIDAVEEIAMGNEVALTLLSDAPLYNDISVQTYINLLGRWISLESTRPELPWTFAVLDVQAAMVYAIPGGTVLITRGMLAKTKTEAELAGVLAQAMAHVLSRHHLNALATAALTTPTAGWRNLAGGVYAKGLPADEEMEADRQAVVMLTRAGFGPLAMNKAIALTGSNALPKPQLSSLLALFSGPDLLTQQRLTQIKTFMGHRFDAYANTPSVPVAQRLAQLNTRTATSAP